MKSSFSLAQLITKNYTFFLPYLLLLVVVGILQLDFSQTALMLLVHQHYQSLVDTAFLLITTLGEGTGFCIALALFALFKKGRNAILTLIFAEIISALLAQFFKQKVFDTIDRPVKFFEGHYQGFHLPDGTNALLQDHSFPSGHTTSAFTIFCVATLYAQNKRWGYLFILLAFLVGYSRVYLFQHFVVDAYFGSLLGVSCALLVYWFANRRARG